MNSIDHNDCNNRNMPEMVSPFLSTMGCSWNTNEQNDSEEKSTASSIPTERIPAYKVSYPSFSLTNNGHEEHHDDEAKDYDSDSSYRREAVQSEASKLMSRRGVYIRCKDGDNEEQRQQPQQIMLGNILDSFDQLVDARIRAYARILSNHVQVLSESNNKRGARIAEYKLETLLAVAANHLLFDSISIEFKTIATCAEDDARDAAAAAATTTSTTEDKQFSVPIEVTVDIRSPRFIHEGLETNNCNDAESPPHRGHEGKLTFRAKGKVRGRRNIIGQEEVKSNDKDICQTPESDVCRNSKYSTVEDRNHISKQFFFENIDIDIDCNALLSQMMTEASKVVTMAVELTNLAWTNNTEKQEEIDKMNMNAMVAENTRRTANLIADDDSSTAGEHRPLRMAGKRSRCEDYPDNNTQTGTIMSKQVLEIFFRPVGQVVCDEEQIEEPFEDPQETNALSSSSTSTATITNLHVLEQDIHRNTRYFDVSDPSYDSSSAGSDRETTKESPHENFPPEDHKDGDEFYDNISAERACHIVDFVLAGDIIPCHCSPNKKLRTT